MSFNKTPQLNEEVLLKVTFRKVLVGLSYVGYGYVKLYKVNNIFFVKIRNTEVELISTVLWSFICRREDTAMCISEAGQPLLSSLTHK